MIGKIMCTAAIIHTNAKKKNVKLIISSAIKKESNEIK